MKPEREVEDDFLEIKDFEAQLVDFGMKPEREVEDDFLRVLRGFA